ncbi:hypothetical protein LTR37_002998 [Vermiconidia calcicola]|uniref:Uncharacterized protein n=1 Tax=Vermiconidia calcicola TaxID=1690605 RepID=A0ACC3NRX7_9PEZI|nr:hypothetical protein LTR37_002998 [Vermiconidia calcicola]
MRTPHIFLALPALSVAQQQFPLVDQVKGWFAKASDSITSVTNPVAAGAAKVADSRVQPLTVANYKDVLRPGAATASPGIEEWMVFVTGGNKTCYGQCARAETAFNEAVVLISASSSPPNLALLDCENEPVLCNAWVVGPPNVLHFLIPQPLADQSTPATTYRSIGFNRTTVTATQIAAIHLEEKYKDKAPYEGIFHPFDGQLAQTGLMIPVGYAIWGFSKIPSWAFMIFISFISRNMMSRRMQPPAPQQGGAPAGGQPAAS